MTLSGLQLVVAQIVGEALADLGFALGGGHALHLRTGFDRISNDIDAYSPSQDPWVYHEAERRVLAALQNQGMEAVSVETERQDWFRAIDVKDPATGNETRVDLGMDYRSHPPVQVQNIGPVLDIEDVVFGKIRALVSRRKERDYVDLDVILRDGRWTFNDVMAYANMYDPSLTRKEFRAILSRAVRGNPEMYAAIGYGPSKVAAMARRFASCGRCRVCGRELTSSRTVSAGVGRRCAERLR